MKQLSSWYKKTVHAWQNISWQRRTVFILAALASALLLGFGVYAITRSAPAPVMVEEGGPAWEEPSNDDIRDDIPGHFIRRKLDGAYVEPETANRFPVAVMIDNDPNARLQSGLAHAQVVYEAKAESGITRFMALFAEGEPVAAVGPVRSARPYFVRWAEGYDALYAHVGGSPEALDYLDTIAIPDINEFYSGKYFWRSDKKFPPHNVYTSTENLRTYLERLGESDFSYRPWQYKREMPNATSTQGISINYSVADFAVRWEYDGEENAYRRYMAGSPHNDADGTPIYAKNIVIMVVPATVVDEQFRRHMATIGSGDAWYCFDGACAEGTWEKDSAVVRERIVGTDGREVRFNGGTTWLQVVQSRGEVEINVK